MPRRGTKKQKTKKNETQTKVRMAFYLVQGPLTMRIRANSSARGWRRSGGLVWNGRLSSAGYMVGSGAFPLHIYFDYRARVFRTLVIFKFSTDPSLVRVQVYHCLHSVLRYCLTLLLK